MLNIFAAIRTALRLGEELGEVAIDIIKEEIIPEMDRLIAEARRPRDVEELTKVRDLWVQYSDEKSPDSKFWRNIAAQALKSGMGKFDAFANQVDEVESRIAYKFLRRSGSYMNTIAKMVSQATDGPVKSGGYWSGTVHTAVLREFTHLYDKSDEKHFPGGQVQNIQDEEGEEVNILEQLKAPRSTTNTDLQAMKDLKEALDKVIETKFKDEPVAMAIYRIWMQLAESKGADAINFKQDIERPVAEIMKKQKIPASKNTIHYAKIELRKAIVSFFERVENRRLRLKFKQSLKLAESLAYEDYFRKLASWVLELHRFSPR